MPPQRWCGLLVDGDGGRLRLDCGGSAAPIQTDLPAPCWWVSAPGSPPSAALRRAGSEVGGQVGAAVENVLRHSKRAGLAAALTQVDGELRPLATALARAQTTGAALIPAVTAHLDERRAMARARAVHEARTLSVRLVVPLALLILPGFVLIAAGPAVIGAINGLLGPVLPAP